MIPRSKTGDCSNQDCNAKNTNCIKVGKELLCLKCRKKAKEVKPIRPAIEKKKLIKNLDAAYSQYVRKKSSNSKGECVCFTCGKKNDWKKMDCGHFVPRGNMALRWDLRNMRPQCVNCNRLNYGEIDTYAIKLDAETNGIVDDLTAVSKAICRYSEQDLLEKLFIIKNELKTIN